MRSIWFLILLGSLITYHCFTTVSGEATLQSSDASQPTFDQCKTYVDAALKTSSPTDEDSEEGTQEEKSAEEREPPDSKEDDVDQTEEDEENDSKTDNESQEDEDATAEADDDSQEAEGSEENGTEEDDEASNEDDDKTVEADATGEDDATEEDTTAEDNATEEDATAEEDATEEDATAEEDTTGEDATTEGDDTGEDATAEDDATEEDATAEDDATEEDTTAEDDATEEDATAEDDATEEDTTAEEGATGEDTTVEEDATGEDTTAEEDATEEDTTAEEDATEEDTTAEDDATGEDATAEEDATGEDATEEDNATEEDATAEDATKEGQGTDEEGDSQEDDANADTAEDDASAEAASAEDSTEQDGGEQSAEEDGESAEDEQKSEEDDQSTDGDTQEDTGEEKESDGSVPSDVADEADQSQSAEDQEDEATQEDQDTAEDTASPEAEDGVSDEQADEGSEEEGSDETEGDSEEEEEEVEPYEPRSRDHITQILGLDDSEQTKNVFSLLNKVTQSTLKDLKSTYENAVKPLEQLYKYRDLSNRHFGDPEIFSKPLVVFMGPWSGGKSTIINWLLGIQNEDNALRTGADPSPAQFNIMMYGDEPEKLDGTQLAADWTFSGLQKFGQSFLDRLRGQKLPNRLLEKVNIVEIPGILEVRKQVERSFPFNDACQWFIDRADTLFLIYDPAKLDIGPETEAILDQLKGRENQVRIVLNKADTIKPDELLRVQAMLVWNISPLMSSAEPPVLYAASLWDRPLQVESPKSLLVAHENNFLKDIRDAVERRVETRIAAARRFAVRVRNHAKMVDCYLNTYNNHRSFFSDKKKVSNDIIDHPQNYHIYEGLSTLTNISRYDLPDPDSYKDFFRVNALWDFPSLSSTCSFFRGCPLHKLDIAIAYDLPEILGKFRRQREAILAANYQQASSKN